MPSKRSSLLQEVFSLSVSISTSITPATMFKKTELEFFDLLLMIEKGITREYVMQYIDIQQQIINI